MVADDAGNRRPQSRQFRCIARAAEAAKGVVANNARDGVTWIHSYFTLDRKRSFCIDDGPSPEAIRAAGGAGRNVLF